MISSNLKRSIVGITGASALALSNVQLAFASCDPSSGSVTDGAACAANNTTSNISVTSLLSSISNILIFLVGAISVIVLIIGGLRYVISAGNPSQVTGAKNTILYAIVGIVISISAYAIVQFVFKQLGVS